MECTLHCSVIHLFHHFGDARQIICTEGWEDDLFPVLTKMYRFLFSLYASCLPKGVWQFSSYSSDEIYYYYFSYFKYESFDLLIIEQCHLKGGLFQAGSDLHLRSLRLIFNFTKTGILYLNECRWLDLFVFKVTQSKPASIPSVMVWEKPQPFIIV